MPPLNWHHIDRRTDRDAADWTFDSPSGGGELSMKKRKPDILWVLVIIFGLGVVTTGYTQSLLVEHADQQPAVERLEP
jgi:hypothetical protein